MHEPCVSVVIPMYNLEKYIAACLDSVLNQTMTDLEIICVDDGSTDGTRQIVQRYMERDQRIQLIVQENAGQSAARNAALSRVQGRYTYFLDGDDSIVPQAMEEAVAFAQEHDLELVAFDVRNTYESPDMARAYPQSATAYQRRQPHPAETDGPSLFRSLQGHQEYFCAPPAHLFRTDFLRAHALRFYEKIIHEDELFTLQAYLRARRAGYLPKTLFVRLLRSGSTMTKTPGMRNVNGYLTVCQALDWEMASGSYDAETVKMVAQKMVDFLQQAVALYERIPATGEKCLWPSVRMQVVSSLFEREKRVLASQTYRVGKLCCRPLVWLRKALRRS